MSPAFMFKAVQECIMTCDQSPAQISHKHASDWQRIRSCGYFRSSRWFNRRTVYLETWRINRRVSTTVQNGHLQFICTHWLALPWNSQSYVVHRCHSRILHCWKCGDWHPLLFTWRSYSMFFHVTALRLPSERTSICSHMRIETRKCQQLRHPCGAVKRSFMTFVTGNDTSISVLRCRHKNHRTMCPRLCVYVCARPCMYTHTHTQCSA